jgi:hypothetical protein
MMAPKKQGMTHGSTVDHGMIQQLQRRAPAADAGCATRCIVMKSIAGHAIAQTMQQNAALTWLDGAPATMAEHCLASASPASCL